MSKPRIAFLGLGTMGGGMARRLLRAGFPLAAFNRDAEKARTLATEGARAAASPREAAANAEVIISMVSDDQAARAVWLGQEGALAAAAPGTICIESSTVTVGWIRELAAAVESKNCALLDAPVTGSKSHAAHGELNFLVGGDAATLEMARPAFAVMGQSVRHIGPTGSGALLKLINNFVCGVQAASLAEAITLIERSGLDRAKALEVLTNGAPGSPIVKLLAVRMTTPDYTPNFQLSLLRKDLHYALKEGDRVALNLVTGKAAAGLFALAESKGLGAKDMAAVIEPFRS